MFELKNITKTYSTRNGDVEALRGVDFVFPKCGLVFIVGKSGSGKSTMLNILGLLDKYDDGDFLIDRKSANSFTQKERDIFRALNIGFVFQEFHIIEKYTIGQNLMLPMEIQHRSVTEEDVEKVLAKVGMEGYFHRKPSEISGGQRQRIAVARAIIKNPSVILADEPTGNLDTQNGTAVFELLQELGKERLVIIISHDMDSANKYADQILELKDGKVASIVKGNKLKETVQLTVNTVDEKTKKEINKLIEQGKRVIISRKNSDVTAKADEKKEVLLQTYADVKKIHLPFKSSLRLSLLSMRSGWMRTFFTIVVTMFAIAFLGFADLVASYNMESLLLDEYEKSGNAFVNVAAEKLRDPDSIFTDYEKISIDETFAHEFNRLNFHSVKKSVFSYNMEPMVVKYTNYFPDRRVAPFLENRVHGVIETENLGELGLELAAGRMPENLNEIVITNYQLEVYKTFGLLSTNTCANYLFDDNPQLAEEYGFKRSKITDITDFSKVEGYTITNSVQIDVTLTGFPLTIVGLVEYDMNAYESLLVKEIVQTTTPEQRTLLYAASTAKLQYLNNWIAAPGFYDNLETHYVKMHMNNWVTYLETPGGEYFEHTMRYAGNWNYVMDELFLSELIRTSQAVLKPGFLAGDLGTGQVTLAYGVVKQLLPVGTFDNCVRERRNGSVEITNEKLFDDILNEYVWNKKLWMSAQGVELSKLDVVALFLSINPNIHPTQDFYDAYALNYTDSYLVPLSSRAEAKVLLNKLTGLGIFEINGSTETEYVRFVLASPHSNGIYRLDDYLKISATIFNVIAFAFMFFAVLLTYTFISSSITQRKKDIGILRSLGASRRDIAGIFIIEGIVIAVLEIILASLACYLGFLVVQKYFISQFGYLAETYKIITYGIRQVLLMAGVTIAAIAVSIFMPIFRIANKQPVDAIRSLQ